MGVYSTEKSLRKSILKKSILLSKTSQMEFYRLCISIATSFLRGLGTKLCKVLSKLYTQKVHIFFPQRLLTWFKLIMYIGFPRWLSGKEPTCQCRRCGFDLWVRKIPWQRKWQPTPGFLPGNPMERGAYQATVHGVAKIQTWLRD